MAIINQLLADYWHNIKQKDFLKDYWVDIIDATKQCVWWLRNAMFVHLKIIKHTRIEINRQSNRLNMSVQLPIKNFDEVFPIIENAIKTCSFIGNEKDSVLNRLTFTIVYHVYLLALTQNWQP